MECNGFYLIYGDEEIKAIFKKRDTIRRTAREVSMGEFKKVLNHLKKMERRLLFKSLKEKLFRIIKINTGGEKP